VKRGLAIVVVLLAASACGGPAPDHASVQAASIQLDRPAGRQFDTGLEGSTQPASPAQELIMLLLPEQIRKAGSSPDPLPGYVGSSPDPLPGFCNDEGDCVTRKGQ